MFFQIKVSFFKLSAKNVTEGILEFSEQVCIFCFHAASVPVFFCVGWLCFGCPIAPLTAAQWRLQAQVAVII